MTHQIKDYLQTQALKLSRDEVAVAIAATQAVLNNAQAHIDDTLLDYDGLPEPFAEHIDWLKPLFMALDSVYSRHAVQSAVIYGYAPEWGQLCRLARVGLPLDNVLPTTETMAQQSLAVRTALSGWANVADSVQKWLALGELTGAQGEVDCQISLPICGEDGVVYGVVYLTAQVPLAAEALADWVGLALGVLPRLREYLPRPQADDEMAAA